MDLAAALAAREGLTCVVGAGGKKTTLYALGAVLDRAVVTATVRIPIFDEHVARVVVTGDPLAALDEAADRDDGDDRGRWPLGLVPEREREDRYLGYDRETVGDLAAAHDGPVLAKADGARMREFKAPGDREPQVPDSATTVLPIASAHAVGKPLSATHVHRPERVAALTDLAEGDPITPEAVGAVLASEAGGLKDVPAGATAIPVVNKVDDEDDEAVAREVAAAVHERADVPRVVLARMIEGRVVDVVE